MNIPPYIGQLLRNMQYAATPLVDVGDGILIKHEALGSNPVHKCRSAAWLWERRLIRYGMPKGVTDRSSGSWAVANSIIAGACRLSSRFVTVGEPHPVVRETVESHGGEFIVVRKNADRRAQLQCLLNKGWWSPDQHNNLQVIQAFEETLGQEAAKDLHQRGVDPKKLRFVVGAVGTGGSLAGLVRGLRAKEFTQFEAVGCDSTASMASSGQHAPSPFLLPVPGVGSADEVCRTFREARKAFPGSMIRINPLLAAEAAAQFRYVIARGCGMSSGLALAAAKRDLVPRLRKGQKILILFSDDASRYGPQLKSVAYAAAP